MKKFKLNKTGRRFCRIIGILFLLLIIWNIYYFSTFTPFSKSLPPITMTVVDPGYYQQINKAQNYLKNVSRRLDVPSLSVSVGHKGKLIWSAAEGYQDMEKQIPATPKTQYRIGSSSKAVTATGIAKAVHNHRIDLDAVIGDSIINWERKQWGFTMRQLLSHTAGIGNYGDFKVSSWKYTLCNCYEFKSVTEGLKVFNSTPLLYEPGTDFAYSTFDVNLASAVLEQAVQESFPDYMDNAIFKPLEMRNTYADHTRSKSEHFATFYETEDGYYREFRSFEQLYDINLSYKWAGGGFISTPTDLVKLGNAWLTDTTFIDQKTKRQFWTPVKLKNGKVNEQQYAVGWRSYLSFKDQRLGGGKTSYWIVHHGGVSKGSQNLLILFPNYDLVIDASINANIESFSKLFDEVLRLANVFLEPLERKESSLFLEIKKEIEL